MDFRISFFVLMPMMCNNMSFSQNISANNTTIPKYATPSATGGPRSKFLEVIYERVAPSKVASTARRSAINDTLPGDHIQHSTITRNNRIAVKARFPIFNKPSLKIVGGFRYNYEEFQFKTVPNEFSI